MKFSIKEIKYTDVEPFWRRDLWPDRKDPIRSMSSMILGGGFDMKIYDLYSPSFSGLFCGDDLVGTLSGHPVSESQFRIRGLYIKESYRRHGGSQLLFADMKTKALRQGCTLIWSYPRLTALSVYQKFGFDIHPSDRHDHNHVYVFLNAVI